MAPYLNPANCFVVLGWPKSPFGFFRKMALAALAVFNFIQNNFVRLYCDSCHTSVQLKKPSKLVNFCVAILILNMEENTLYYFKKGKNAIETHKGFVQCMEMVL